MTDPKPFVLLALCVLVLTACASEAPRAMPMGRMAAPAPVISADVFLFLPYDGDHDHRITAAERDAAIAGAWKEAAAGRHTVRLLGLQDWFVKIEGAAATPFDPLEFAPDGGDNVSRDQFAAALIRRFEALDKNGDGVLDPSELMTVPKIEREPPRGMGPEGMGGGMRRHRPGGMGGDD
jgi:EF hand